MSVYEKQIQATAKYHDPEARDIEHNGGDLPSAVVPESDTRGYEWADVLKDLEPYY